MSAGVPKYLPRVKLFAPDQDFGLVDAVSLAAEGERVLPVVLDGVVYVAYLTAASGEIHAKKLAWETAPDGWAPTSCP